MVCSKVMLGEGIEKCSDGKIQIKILGWYFLIFFISPNDGDVIT